MRSSPRSPIPRPSTPHVDIFLGPEYQDRGLGTDALRTIVRHLLDERGHHRITLGTSVQNARAIRCYEKVGFRTVGTMRKSALSHRNGQWEDELPDGVRGVAPAPAGFRDPALGGSALARWLLRGSPGVGMHRWF